MKGKPTWKPVGLRAKRWREAAHAKSPVSPLPSSKTAKVFAKKGQSPFLPEKGKPSS